MTLNPFKSSLQKGRELAEKHPEDFKVAYIENWLERNPYDGTNLYRYSALVNANKIPFTPVTTRRQIEDFTYFPLFDLKKGDQHVSQGGDRDDINEPETDDFIGGEKRKNAYRTAVNNGASLRAIMERKGIFKGGQTFLNAKALENIGIEVRCSDNTLYEAITKKEDKLSACVWTSTQEKPDYIRKEGFPQEKGSMIYEGIILDGVSDDHQMIAKSLLNGFDERFKISTPLKEVEYQVERLRNSSAMSTITNGKHTSLAV